MATEPYRSRVGGFVLTCIPVDSGNRPVSHYMVTKTAPEQQEASPIDPA
jgi:hypothetical protein